MAPKFPPIGEIALSRREGLARFVVAASPAASPRRGGGAADRRIVEGLKPRPYPGAGPANDWPNAAPGSNIAAMACSGRAL